MSAYSKYNSGSRIYLTSNFYLYERNRELRATLRENKFLRNRASFDFIFDLLKFQLHPHYKTHEMCRMMRTSCAVNGIAMPVVD